MRSVYVVQHSYQLDFENSGDETKFIGVYSSKQKAEEAVERLKKQPGFDRLPDYFFIDEYELNQDHWKEGFVTERYAPIFSIWRKDRNDNVYLVKDGLVEVDALRLVRELGHNDKTQTFYAKEHA